MPGHQTMKSMTMTKQILGLAAWLALTFTAAGIGAIASANAGDFYQQLSRPDWAPPASLFGQVWSVLYLLIGIAAWLVWRERGFSAAKRALVLFAIQLAANALWTWLFFAWRFGAVSFIEILFLWMLIVATLVAFWRVRRLAGALLLPYLAWVTYATALTFSVWQRNPQALS